MAVAAAIARDSYSRVNGVSMAERCLPCVLGVMLKNGMPGTGWRTDWNHCIPRSRLPGQANWHLLHNEANLAGTCRLHHAENDGHAAYWLPLMAKAYPEYAEFYRQPPFAAYLSETS